MAHIVTVFTSPDDLQKEAPDGSPPSAPPAPNTPPDDSTPPASPIVPPTHASDTPVNGPDADIFGQPLPHASEPSTPSVDPLGIVTVLTPAAPPTADAAPAPAAVSAVPPMAAEAPAPIVAPSEAAPAPSSAFVVPDDPPLNFAVHGAAADAAGSGVTWTSDLPAHFDSDVFAPVEHAHAGAVAAEASFFSYDWGSIDWDSLLHKSAADWFVV